MPWDWIAGDAAGAWKGWLSVLARAWMGLLCVRGRARGAVGL